MIWRLSSMPFTGTVLALLTSNIYSPRVTQDNGTWSRLLISFFGMLCSTTKLEIFFWNIRFSSRGSPPFLSFILKTLIHLLLAQSPVSLKGLPVFINIVELLAFRTPFPAAITKRREIAAPASQVLIITFLTFLRNCHLANSDGLFFFEWYSARITSHFFFQLLIDVLTKLYFG